MNTLQQKRSYSVEEMGYGGTSAQYTLQLIP